MVGVVFNEQITVQKCIGATVIAFGVVLYAFSKRKAEKEVDTDE